MRKFALVLFTSLLLAFPVLPGQLAHRNDAAVSTATREGRLIVFDDAWESVRTLYYDASLHGVDWDAQRLKFRPLAAEATDERAFYRILRRMIGTLNDVHTRVFAPGERFNWSHPRYIGVGISVREIENLPVVVSVEKGSPAEREGLRPGDIITTVDGEPALEVFARKLNEQIGASTMAAIRVRAMATLFEGDVNSTLRFGWIDRKGRLRTTELRREWREVAPSLIVDELRNGVVMIDFNIFTRELASALFRDHARTLGEARGIIFDLRDNGGGDAEAMADIASAFLPAGRSLGLFINRLGVVDLELRTTSTMLTGPDVLPVIKSPIVILASERTSSAAEIFADALARENRGTVVGTKSCGCVLAIRRRHILPDGGELDISEMDYRSDSGERLEGRGITPRETVRPSLQDIRSRRDPAVELGLTLLQTRLRN